MGGNAYPESKAVTKTRAEQIYIEFIKDHESILGKFCDIATAVPVGSYGYKNGNDLLGDIDLIAQIKQSHRCKDLIISAGKALHHNNIKYRDFSGIGFLTFLYKETQIDFHFVNDLEWSKFAFGYSNENKSNYKYAHRNELFYILASYDNEKHLDGYKRRFFNLHNGYECGFGANSPTPLFKRKDCVLENDELIISPHNFLSRIFVNPFHPGNWTFEHIIHQIETGGCKLEFNTLEFYEKVKKAFEKKRLVIPSEIL